MLWPRKSQQHLFEKFFDNTANELYLTPITIKSNYSLYFTKTSYSSGFECIPTFMVLLPHTYAKNFIFSSGAKIIVKNNMGESELYSPLPYTRSILKINLVESSIQQTLSNFRDLVTEIEQLNVENKHLKSLQETNKANKESIPCCNCEALQLEVVSKDETFDALLAVIRKLCDTQDLSALQAIKELLKSNTKTSKENIQDNSNLSPKKNIENINNESICEIEGTPTGSKSPIIQGKKGKTQLSLKDKKKCPEEWPTPEKKNIKLSFQTPTRTKSSGRLKQARLSLVKIKSTNVVDLTCSPEYMGTSYNESHKIQCNIKKDVMDNDDTIPPSPTSGGPVNLPLINKPQTKDSPSRLNKLQMSMKLNFEADKKENMENIISTDIKGIDDSINLLQNYTKRLKSPKQEKFNDPHANQSILLSLLNEKKSDNNTNTSPNRRPLLENRNIINARDTVSSLSKPKIESLYKEPVVRKKAEKRALPGWSCDECRDFFDELYKYDPEMLAKKMDECSKHRGRNNPARPKTPDGFWNPRWDVPDDTEEFNRRNNV